MAKQNFDEPAQMTSSVDNSVTTVFVDGSYNANTNEYGYGVYMTKGKHARVLFGKGVCRDNGRNVEGEVAGAQAALAFIKDHTKLRNIVVYHDYQGIGDWADEKWKANKTYTKEYAAFVKECRAEGMSVKFEHVKGHTGVHGNEYVDKIAKYACGVDLTRSDKTLLSEIADVKGMPDYSDSVDPFDDNSLSLIGR